MTIQTSARAYSQGFGTTAVSVPVIALISPNSMDVNYPVGQRWINTVTNAEYDLTSLVSSSGTVTATWTLLGTNSGALNTLSDQSATTVTPSAGNIQLNGTSSQITTTAGSHEITWSLSSTLVAPGTLAVTGLLTANDGATILGTTGISGTTTITGNTNINTSGIDNTNIGTGSGITTIGNSSAPTSLEGATTVVGLLTADAGATLNTGGTAINIATDSDTSAVNIATTGVRTTTIGDTTGASTLVLHSGTGGISLSAAGDVSVVPATSSTGSPTASVTMNNRVGCATFTGFTTAAAGTQSFTITNSTVLATSSVHVTVANLNASTNGAEMSLAGVTQATGSIIVNTKNNGGGALGTGDNVLINFWIIS
jgi:hypothetical protein